jgi:putative transcriptional regulator
LPIEINLDLMLVKRKMTLTELSQRIGITMANLSILKQGHARAIRFSTLEKICEALDCQPGDLLGFKKDGRP